MAQRLKIHSSGKSQRIRLSVKVVAIILITIVVIGGVYYLFSVERQPETDKSIAILPFINDSAEESEMYFINGTMEAILNNLVKIEDLRVVSRTSVEQYRDNPKAISEIAEEMKVSYILEGSGQKYGNHVRLTLQLLDAINDNHIWSEEYDREIREIEDLFALQSEIAQLVAAEIEARVTLEEKHLIEKIPTTSQAAYELYQKGREEHLKYTFTTGYSDKAQLQRVEDLMRYALEFDSIFAWPYATIASIYLNKHLLEPDYSSEYLDSTMIYIEYALSFDDQYAEAYDLRGWYHRQTGELDKAIEDFNKSLELAPNFWGSFQGLAYIHKSDNDLIGALDNLHKAVLIDRGPTLPNTLRNLSDMYLLAGFNDQSVDLSKQALELDGDSAKLYYALASAEYFISNNASKAIKLLKHGHAIDTSNTAILALLGRVYLSMGQYTESLRYIEKKIDRLNRTVQLDLWGAMVTGCVFLMNGNMEKAEYYFDQQIKYGELLSNSSKDIRLQLAIVYASRGEREKAYENLRLVNQMERFNVFATEIFRDNYFFMSIQDESEYKAIKSEIIAKYQAEHERVRQWLEENEML